MAFASVNSSADKFNGTSTLKTETNFGLSTTTFDTLEGTVTVNLPDDLAAGDTISGTVTVEAKGQTEQEKARNQDQLQGYVVEIERQPTPVTQDTAKWLIPADGTAVPVVLKNHQGRELGRASVRVQHLKPTVSEEFKTPMIAQSGRPFEIKGPFDGDLKTTAVRGANTLLKALAESPRKVVAQNLSDKTGQMPIEISENGRVVARCIYHTIGVRLSANKLNLINGEQTQMTLTVIGLEGFERSAIVTLQNKSAAVVRLDGGDSQEFSIDPKQTHDGTFVTTRTLTGIKSGTFSINATVHAVNDDKAQCDQPGSDSTRGATPVQGGMADPSCQVSIRQHPTNPNIFILTPGNYFTHFGASEPSPPYGVFLLSQFSLTGARMNVHTWSDHEIQAEPTSPLLAGSYSVRLRMPMRSTEMTNRPPADCTQDSPIFNVQNLLPPTPSPEAQNCAFLSRYLSGFSLQVSTQVQATGPIITTLSLPEAGSISDDGVITFNGRGGESLRTNVDTEWSVSQDEAGRNQLAEGRDYHVSTRTPQNFTFSFPPRSVRLVSTSDPTRSNTARRYVHARVHLTVVGGTRNCQEVTVTAPVETIAESLVPIPTVLVLFRGTDFGAHNFGAHVTDTALRDRAILVVVPSGTVTHDGRRIGNIDDLRTELNWLSSQVSSLRYSPATSTFATPFFQGLETLRTELARTSQRNVYLQFVVSDSIGNLRDVTFGFTEDLNPLQIPEARVPVGFNYEDLFRSLIFLAPPGPSLLLQ